MVDALDSLGLNDLPPVDDFKTLVYTDQLGAYENYCKVIPYNDVTSPIVDGRSLAFEEEFLSYYNSGNKSPLGAFNEIPMEKFSNDDVQGDWLQWLSDLGGLGITVDNSTVQTFLQYSFVQTGNAAVIKQFDELSDLSQDLGDVELDLNSLVNYYNQRVEPEVFFVFIDPTSISNIPTGDAFKTNSDGDDIYAVNPWINKTLELGVGDYDSMQDIYNRLTKKSQSADGTLANPPDGLWTSYLDENGDTVHSKYLQEQVTATLAAMEPYFSYKVLDNDVNVPPYGIYGSDKKGAIAALSFDWGNLDSSREWTDGEVIDPVTGKSKVIPVQSRVAFTLQQSITAVTTANDVNTEDVRVALFIFEEFYKAAGTMVDAISEMLEGTARKITG